MTECFIDWVNEIRSHSGHEFIAIDGKTLRHSFEGKPHNAFHSITVWLTKSGMVFCQKKSEGKKNEIKSAQALLETLELKNTTVTLDAMHCQKKTATIIRQRKADYVLCVKGNQKGLMEELTDWFDGYGEQFPNKASTFKETDADHGRIEERNYIQLPITDQLEKASDWKGARSIVRVERHRHIGEKQTSETIYYITSHEPDAKFIADAIRSHWQVENKVHWVLDVVYREDESRIRRGNGAENFAIFRRLCMNLARSHPKKNSMRGKLKSAGWNDDFCEELLFGIKG